MMDKRTWVLDSFLLALILPGALSCGLGTKHTIKGEDGSYETRCCLDTISDIGTAAVLCSFEGGPAWCKDCGDGFFQNSSGPSYKITSCIGHRTCSYSQGKMRLEEGTSVSNVVCGCDFRRGFVAKEEYIKNSDGDTFRLVENPESCRQSKCPELKRDGGYVTCAGAVSSKRTTTISTPKQLPSQESSETRKNNPNSLSGGISAGIVVLIIVVLMVGGLVIGICWHKLVLCFCPHDNKRGEDRTLDTNSTSESENASSLLRPNENNAIAGNMNDIMVAFDVRPVPTTDPEQDDTERKLEYEVNETSGRVRIKNNGLKYDPPRDGESIVMLTSNDTSGTSVAGASNVHSTGASDHASVHSSQGTTPVHNTGVHKGTIINIFNGGNHTHQCNIL